MSVIWFCLLYILSRIDCELSSQSDPSDSGVSTLEASDQAITNLLFNKFKLILCIIYNDLNVFLLYLSVIYCKVIFLECSRFRFVTDKEANYV